MRHHRNLQPIQASTTKLVRNPLELNLWSVLLKSPAAIKSSSPTSSRNSWILSKVMWNLQLMACWSLMLTYWPKKRWSKKWKEKQWENRSDTPTACSTFGINGMNLILPSCTTPGKQKKEGKRRRLWSKLSPSLNRLRCRCKTNRGNMLANGGMNIIKRNMGRLTQNLITNWRIE